MSTVFLVFTKKYQFKSVQITFGISADDGEQVAMVGKSEEPRSPDLAATAAVLSADT